MMQCEIIAIGKTENNYIKTGIDEYLKRLKHYFPTILTSIPLSKKNVFKDKVKQKNAEGQMILKHIQPTDFCIALDEHGKQFSSNKLANFMEEKMVTGQRKIVFIIGGAFGIDENVLKRANLKLSLSEMTFTHQMVRLFIVEQLYRAGTIVKGEPYHNN